MSFFYCPACGASLLLDYEHVCHPDDIVTVEQLKQEAEAYDAAQKEDEAK
jgi:hypothetical protein